MAWSEPLQTDTDRLLEALIARSLEEVGSSRPVTASTDPCRHLGICEEDLDDLQIDATARCGLRLPIPGEPLVMPWHGPDYPLTLADLAGWLAANSRPVD